MASNGVPLVWIDLEMTGLDADHCHILEIASLITDGDLNILAEGPNLVLHQDEDQLSTLSDWSREHFTASGLIERARASTVSLADAELATLEFVARHCPQSKSPLCGNSIHSDRAFLARHMTRLHDWLHYRNVDVSTVKEIARRWYGPSFQPPKKADSHVALTDIRESVAELRYYRDTFFIPRG